MPRIWVPANRPARYSEASKGGALLKGFNTLGCLMSGDRAIIRLDAGMIGGRAEIKVRKALFYYTQKHRNADTDLSTGSGFNGSL